MVRLPCPSDLRRPSLWWILGAGALASFAGAWVLQQSGSQLILPLPLPQAQPAPAPPAQAAWDSPLHRQCGAEDPQLKQRLRRLQRDYPDAVVKLQIDPTNYGERLSHDAFGNALSNRPSLVVLHETVYGLQSALNTFQTANQRDDDQVSYHVLIGEDGRVVEALDPSKRAYGAGYSAFAGQWVVTNAALDGSVNNFALHISLETPLDGENSAETHSGYSAAQYDALAVVLADWMKQFKIPADRITTHRHVDLGHERADPRSFNWDALQQRLAALGVLC